MMQMIQQQLRSGAQNRVILLALLLALLLLNLPSSGIVHYGPGADDEGSGLGGTGRSPIPGSDSGLGGTGFRPFVGYTDSAEDVRQDPGETTAPSVTIYHQPAERELAVRNSIALDIPAQRSVTASPVPSPRKTLRKDDYTRDSSAILISEQIQQDIDSYALFFTQLDARLETANEASPDRNFVPAHEADNPEPQSSDEVSWLALSNYLADQQDSLPDDDTNNALAALSDNQNEGDQRMQRPDRIQRPELPAMQRVRPVQRAGVLPPRIKPLKL